MNKRETDKKYFFEKAVENTICKYDMLKACDKVVVALSGGADSVSLLCALHSRAEKLGISLFACHLNHMIRKETATRDEEFSKKLCEKLSVPFYSEKVDVPCLCKKTSGSVETVARNARYEFFSRAAEFFGANKVATAHTASDNAETVLFNLTRGTSSDGICGIPPIRDCFIRPLICRNRREVEEYLDFIGQDFVTDESNFCEEYSRNFIRNSVIPQLKRLNPELESAIFRLSESMREDKTFLQDQKDKYCFEKMTAKELSDLPPSILKRHIKELFLKSSAKSAFLSSKNIDDILCAIKSYNDDKRDRKICLDCGLFAVIGNSGIYFTNNIPQKTTQEFFDIPATFGENIINKKYAVFMTQKSDCELPLVIKNQDIVYKLYKKARLISDIIDDSVFIRQRLEKDVFRLGGISRKLKKVFADMKIPTDERALVPIVYKKNDNAPDTILCVPFYSSACDNAKCEQEENSVTVAFYRS